MSDHHRSLDRALAKTLGPEPTPSEGGLRALREGIERLADSIEGDEGIAHNYGCEGEPTCFACIVADLRRLLAHPAPEPQHDATVAATVDCERLPSAPCRDCGPGYRIGDEGCRHDPYEPSSDETGVCRTCAQPIWWEEGEVAHRKLIGWSDRIERGGDSLVCFKAIGYRHVPMGAREEAIYNAGLKAGRAAGSGER